jgi:hypothetical protein
MKSIIPLFLVSLLWITACDTGLQGDFKENRPPKTFFNISEINLPEGERLVSQISISWWGDDPDGYVVGYEFVIGDTTGAEWVYTTSTDSTFVLPIPQGEMDANVRFTVRAIDNEDARDPEPPSLVFPIRNSPPEIAFARFQTPPDTTYRVASFGWDVSDPDGNANLNRVEIAVNDTTQWFAVPVENNFITLRIDDTGVSPDAQVLLGRALSSSGIRLPGVITDAENTLYVRAFDNAEAVSRVISHTWYVKQQRSRILFLHDYEGPDGPARVNLHLGILRLAGITTVDFWNISDGIAIGGNRVPFTNAFPDRSLVDPTINLMLAEWDHIYWLSNNLDRNIGYAIETTLGFFENGGTMFINIPTKRIPDDSPVLEFLPFERMATLPAGQQSFFIANGSEVIPSETITDPPRLVFRRNQLAAVPIVPFGETVRLFEADFKTRPVFGQPIDFEGSKLISATNPQESILFFGIDLSEFTADSDLTRLIRFAAIETLGFQQ